MKRFEYIDIQYFVGRRVKLEIVENLLEIALEQMPRTFAALKMLSRLTAIDLSEVLSVGLEMTRCLLLTPRFSNSCIFYSRRICTFSGKKDHFVIQDLKILYYLYV